MHRVDNATSADVMPDVGPVGPNPNGFFRSRNTELGQPGTTVDPSWLNTVQEELCNVITGAGIALSKNSRTQLYDAIQSLISGSVDAASPTIVKTITQNSHGYTKGTLLYFNGTTWLKAKADNLATSWTVGMVYEVQSTNVFKLLLLGYIDGLSGLTAGATHYLSTTVAGAMQDTSPTTDGEIIKGVLIADSATSGYFFNFTPLVYGENGTITDALLASNNLSDLDDVIEARTNLGLGSAALAPASQFVASSTLSTLATKTELNNLDDDLQGQIDTQTTNIAGALTDIESLQADVTSIEDSINDLNGSIDDLNDDVTSALALIAGKQPLDAKLTAMAAVTFTPNTFMYATGASAFASSAMTAFGRSVVATVNAAGLKSILSFGTAADADVEDFISSSELPSLATISYVDGKVLGLASQSYVNTQIAAALGDYYTGEEVDEAIATAIGALDFATEEYVDTEISSAIDALDFATPADVASAVATKQPLDATLTAFAAVTFSANTYLYATAADTFATGTITAFGRSMLDDADAAAVRTTLGLGTAALAASTDFIPSSTLSTLATISYVDSAIDDFVTDTYVNDAIGTALEDYATTSYVDTSISNAINALDFATESYVDNAISTYSDLADETFQPIDDNLTALSAVSIGEDTILYGTGTGVYSSTALTEFARSFLDDADAAAVRTTLGLVIGSNVQAYDADLAAIAGLTSAANKLPYFTGAAAASLTDFTAFARTLLDDADAATMRGTLGLGTAAVAASTDFIASSVLPTLATVTYVDGAFQPLNAVLSELTALTDPNKDALTYWNNTTNNFEFLELSDDFDITAGILSVVGGGGGGIAAVEDDTDPHLGGNLNNNGFNFLVADGFGIIDSNENPFIKFLKTASADAWLEISNSTSNPKIQAITEEAFASAHLDLQSTGIFGQVRILNGDDPTKVLAFRSDGAASTQTIIYTTSTASRDFFLPDKSGTFAMLDDITGGGIAAVEDDPAPKLGGNLDGDGVYGVFNIDSLTSNGEVQAYGNISTYRSGAGGFIIESGASSASATTSKIISNQTANRTFDLPDASGILALVSDITVTASSTTTFTNKTLTSPRVGTAILDTNGNELFVLAATSSAVNEFTVTNSATGASPALSASGNDSVLDIRLIPKGSGGRVRIESSSSATTTIEFLPGGSARTTVQSNASTGRTITLPDATDTLIGKDTTDVLTNKTVTNCKETVATPTVSAGAVTISLANGTLQKVVTAANTTITLPSAVAGTSYTIVVQYGGSHTITWAGGGTLKWAGGVAPTATSSNGKYDIYVFVCHDSTNTLASDGGRNY